MDNILLFGGGGHCKSVIDVIEQEGKFKIAGIIDKPELLGTSLLNYKVIGCDADVVSLSETYQFALITVGQVKSAATRIRLFEQIKSAGFIVPSIISPRAYVSEYATLGEGCVVMHDALVNAGVTIEKNCIINTKSLIEHDSVIGSHCHISTGAIVNGNVEVGGGSFVGSQAVTREGIKIPKGSFIKAGSLVK